LLALGANVVRIDPHWGLVMSKEFVVAALVIMMVVFPMAIGIATGNAEDVVEVIAGSVPCVLLFLAFSGLMVWLFSTFTRDERREVEVTREYAAQGYTPGMCGHKYEHFVAAQLRNFGWSAHVTQGSGDQGVDIIARKGLFVMAVQCKRYASNVGNKAVQEVFAGASFIDADLAVVVTDSGYTQSARTLANKLGVKLAHHSQIGSFKIVVE